MRSTVGCARSSSKSPAQARILARRRGRLRRPRSRADRRAALSPHRTPRRMGGRFPPARHGRRAPPFRPPGVIGMAVGRRVAVLTLGCKVNQYESRALEEALERRGTRSRPTAGPTSWWSTPVRSPTAPTATPGPWSAAPAAKIRRRASSLRDASPRWTPRGRSPGGRPRRGERGQGGPGGTDRFRRFGGRAGGAAGPLLPEPPAPVTRFGRARAFLKVQDGCDAGCAYCIVPRARGAPRSLPPDEVVSGSLGSGRAATARWCSRASTSGTGGATSPRPELR